MLISRIIASLLRTGARIQEAFASAVAGCFFTAPAELGCAARWVEWARLERSSGVVVTTSHNKIDCSSAPFAGAFLSSSHALSVYSSHHYRRLRRPSYDGALLVQFRSLICSLPFSFCGFVFRVARVLSFFTSCCVTFVQCATFIFISAVDIYLLQRFVYWLVRHFGRLIFFVSFVFYSFFWPNA